MSMLDSDSLARIAAESKQAFTKKSMLGFAKSPLTLGIAGAGLGGYIGSQVDPNHPVKDAAVGVAAGAGVGVVAAGAIKGMSMWKNIGPVGRTAATIGLSLAIGVGAKALHPDESYERNDVLTNDDTIVSAGSYSVQNPGVSARQRSMNASGDVVLGLHNKRR
jgi:hypothetical protein